MKPFRVLLLVNVFLAFANVVNAQSISAASMRSIQTTSSTGCGFGIETGSCAIEFLRHAKPSVCEPCWFTQAVSYLRSRVVVNSDAKRCCSGSEGAAGCVAGPVCPLPTQTGAVPYPLTQVTGIITIGAQPARPARLITPDLEAHCEKMTHRGDTIMLEGNVLLLCKKHAQPMRIEAQRVIVNMKDGSFSVDGASQMTTIGIMRTSLVEQAGDCTKLMLKGFQFEPYYGRIEISEGSFMPRATPPTPSREWIPIPGASDRIIRVIPVPPRELPNAAPFATPIWLQR